MSYFSMLNTTAVTADYTTTVVGSCNIYIEISGISKRHLRILPIIFKIIILCIDNTYIVIIKIWSIYTFTQLPTQYVDVHTFYIIVFIILKCIFWVHSRVKNQGRPGPTRPTRWTHLWVDGVSSSGIKFLVA